jgi:ankyrin repeat protein
VQCESVLDHPVAKGWTPLRRAAIRSNLELARMLVAAGADPHITDDDEQTILFEIDWDEASPALVDYLFGLGIDINQRSSGGHTLLMQAVHRRHVAAVRRILDAGGDPSIRDDQGMSAMDYAEKELVLHQAIVSFGQRSREFRNCRSVATSDWRVISRTSEHHRSM